MIRLLECVLRILRNGRKGERVNLEENKGVDLDYQRNILKNLPRQKVVGIHPFNIYIYFFYISYDKEILLDMYRIDVSIWYNVGLIMHTRAYIYSNVLF